MPASLVLPRKRGGDTAGRSVRPGPPLPPSPATAPA